MGLEPTSLGGLSLIKVVDLRSADVGQRPAVLKQELDCCCLLRALKALGLINLNS